MCEARLPNLRINQAIAIAADDFPEKNLRGMVFQVADGWLVRFRISSKAPSPSGMSASELGSRVAIAGVRDPEFNTENLTVTSIYACYEHRVFARVPTHQPICKCKFSVNLLRAHGVLNSGCMKEVVSRLYGTLDYSMLNRVEFYLLE